MLKRKSVIAVVLAALLAMILVGCSMGGSGDFLFPPDETTTSPPGHVDPGPDLVQTGVFVNGDLVPGARFLTLDDQGNAVEPSVPGEFMPATHLPLTVVAQAIGQDVIWNRATGEVTLVAMTVSPGNIAFDVGSNSFMLDGQPVQLETAAFEVNGELYAPLDFFTNVFGLSSVVPAAGRVDVRV